MTEPLKSLMKAVREMIETVDLHDPEELLALDSDPHPPSTINAAADQLQYALERYEAFLAGNETF